MPVALSVASHRRHPSVPWLLLGGYTVATFDMVFAIAYWAPHGISASHVLQSIATWILGPAAYTGGGATALLGAFIYGHLMWGVVALYHAIARRHTILLRQPVRYGALYGAAAYFAIFKIMAPVLTHTPPDFKNVTWTLACIAVFMTLVGIPSALFSRAAASVRRT